MSDVFKTSLNFGSRNDSYAATGVGVTVSCSAPVRDFSVCVKGTGAGATSWTVLVEGSNDGINWTTIISHTDSDGDGKTKVAVDFPVNFFRSHCSAVSLGSATAIVAQIVGMQ